MTTEQIRDLVSRVRYSFETRGESRIVLMWLESGAGLPAHYHPRQEERWSVVQGRARFQLGRLKRVIGPDDGEIVVVPGVDHGV